MLNSALPSFFPSVIKEWNRIDINIRNSDSISISGKRLLNFMRLLPNQVPNPHNPEVLKLLRRLLLHGVSHLRDHKF